MPSSPYPSPLSPQQELQVYLNYLNFNATKKQVHDMVWEVDDSSTGSIRLETIRSLLKRMQRAKNRGVGTGSNLLRTLIEYMMFDTDGSGGIEIEEVQQMFFIYYGYKGAELDMKIKEFQKLRADPNVEIEFGEFLELMDTLDLKVAVQEEREPPPPRKPIIPSARTRSPPRLLRSRRGDKAVRGPTEPQTARSPPHRLAPISPPAAPKSPGGTKSPGGPKSPGASRRAFVSSGQQLLNNGNDWYGQTPTLPDVRTSSVQSMATCDLFTFNQWTSPGKEKPKEAIGASSGSAVLREKQLYSMKERQFLKKSQGFMHEYTSELKMRKEKAEKAKEFTEPKMTISNALIKR